MKTKTERLEIFIARMKRRASAATFEEARQMVVAVLNEVEDEFSGVPSSPDLWLNDGRLYPPQEDSIRDTASDEVKRLRSKEHDTFVAANGAIRIQHRGGEVLLDKSGRDGRTVKTLLDESEDDEPD